MLLNRHTPHIIQDNFNLNVIALLRALVSSCLSTYLSCGDPKVRFPAWSSQQKSHGTLACLYVFTKEFIILENIYILAYSLQSRQVGRCRILVMLYQLASGYRSPPMITRIGERGFGVLGSRTHESFFACVMSHIFSISHSPFYLGLQSSGGNGRSKTPAMIIGARAIPQAKLCRHGPS